MIKVRGEITDRMSRERLALEVKRARRPALIYAGLIVVAIVVGAMVLSHSRIVYPWETPRKYTLTVQNAAGVRPGLQDVRISGMKAGVISDATTSAGRALITVSVDRLRTALR
jgi:ABC-type transporter Mla subunit MlaD